MPFIIGYGGINAAGLSSTDQAYLNMVSDALDEKRQQALVHSLHSLRGAYGNLGEHKDHADNKGHKDYSHNGHSQASKHNNSHPPPNNPTGSHLHQALTAQQQHFFIRKIPTNLFDTATASYYRLDGKQEKFPISFAATLPEDFDLSGLYNSRYHPRGLQLAVFAANDALGSAGLDTARIHQAVAPHRCAVYAGSALGQLDQDSMEGMLTAALRKKKTVTKQLPFSYPQMAADFVNAYVLKNLGQTGNQCGACATFLYNLSHAVAQIKSGRIDLALVGASEAPIMPQVMAAFYNMGALASDRKIGELDPRHASIPFGDNYGFVMAESAQFIILASAEAAHQLGANIYGMVSDVFISADGGKHSISAPGPGNYITLGRAAAALEKLHGTQTLKHKSYLQAHGTSTPQNRITESHIFSSVATAFDIPQWNVVAIKSCIGHSQAAAGGDQITNSLSFWQHGILPGITTLRQPAADVATKNLHFNTDHQAIGVEAMDAVLVNAKGFGGNNATAVVSSPQQAQAVFTKLIGKKKLAANHQAVDTTQTRRRDYLAQANQGQFTIRYDFDQAVLQSQDVELSRSGVRIKGYPEISFES